MIYKKMILLTGAAGFIGSCMLSFLNKKGNDDIIIVDDFSKKIKENNWKNKKYSKVVNRNELFNYLNNQNPEIECIIHLGARTDTTEKEWNIFEELNLEYSKSLFIFATKNNIPFIYASSAATYGNGNLGFKDSHDIVNNLIPLNPYGKSKNDFDKWILTQENKPDKWHGFKFFNVYGPNEYHKKRMASVILHTFRQIQSTGKMKLFRSHHVDFKDGKQQRDFIYVKDLIQVLYLFSQDKIKNGIYNLGTGKARTFLDLANNVFDSLHITSDISFIDTPIDIRNNYQYFTEADSNKLSSALENHVTFHSLEEGVKDYVQNYLIPNTYY
jgi:ADP-L-glycero-D-manno-heptose 6-epimerase